MRTLFTRFYRRNWALARLEIQSQLEYRFNFLIDTFFQPIIAVAIECLLWWSIFRMQNNQELGGFSRESYLSYAIWANFVSRVTTNWMHETRMMISIETGAISAILLRPLSIFEYFGSQFFGYKMLVIFSSLIFPALVCWFFDLPFQVERLPGFLALIFLSLLFAHLFSYCLSTATFHMTKVHSLTMAKALLIWTLSGDSIPLDLFPDAIRELILALPFASAVYVPVAYLVGRIQLDQLLNGFVSVAYSCVLLFPFGVWLWRRGLSQYTGVGA